jgi:hypothetical protein
MANPALGVQLAREIYDIKDKLTPPNLEIARRTLDTICFRMDAQGKELFLNWLHGRIESELILDDASWQAYMNADVSHRLGLEKKLREVANAQWPKLKASSGRPVSESFSTKGFPAYLGTPGGGYWRGYEQLHGANLNVGGMQIVKGQLSAQMGPAPYDYMVTFTELDLAFNDVTDPAHGNPADGVAAGSFKALAGVLGIGPPKDFITRIRWRSSLTVKMALGPNHACSTNWSQ